MHRLTRVVRRAISALERSTEQLMAVLKVAQLSRKMQVHMEWIMLTAILALGFVNSPHPYHLGAGEDFIEGVRVPLLMLFAVTYIMLAWPHDDQNGAAAQRQPSRA